MSSKRPDFLEEMYDTFLLPSIKKEKEYKEIYRYYEEEHKNHNFWNFCGCEKNMLDVDQRHDEQERHTQQLALFVRGFAYLLGKKELAEEIWKKKQEYIKNNRTDASVHYWGSRVEDSDSEQETDGTFTYRSF